MSRGCGDKPGNDDADAIIGRCYDATRRPEQCSDFPDGNYPGVRSTGAGSRRDSTHSPGVGSALRAAPNASERDCLWSHPLTEQRTHPTLLHRLVALPSTQRKAAVFRFLNEDGQPAVERSLESLMERALRVGGHLLERANLVAGDRVVLVYLPSLDFVEALLGCLMVGVIPAAILPPDPMGGDVERLQRVVDNAQAKALLTHRAFHRARMFGRLSTMTRLRPRAAWPVLPWIVTDAASRAPRAALRFPPGDELALLQYTSGSTGTPKGVRVTHANLAHNVEFITRVGAYHDHSHLLWWVPQYHDFGLVAGIFAALWRGCSLSLLSPFSFLRRPAVWPEALGRLRATHTTSPNFGLELLLRKSRTFRRKLTT